MFTSATPIEQRIKRLQAHLERENPVLLDAVKSFRRLDQVAYRLGMLGEDDSFATRVPWWPMVAILGTFSSGKSTFINSTIGERIQQTGNQAVDDKFTVICFGSDDTNRTLPGLALDADPRFPFYRMSRELEAVAEGEGRRIDAYLQLKTCQSEALRGKIVIDSPGFDADEQRTATLRITDHIVGLADLVLVFFDARHPEPGAMQDTLEHLVSNTIDRADSNKFLYILNQIDNAAREDNPEAVFAAWQRALAQRGLTAGRFYGIYDADAAIPIEDEKLRRRFESKRDADLAEIRGRLHQVEIERAYRIIAVLEDTAKAIEERVVPAVREAKASWRRRVAWTDAIAGGALLVGFGWWSISAGHWEGLSYAPPWLDGSTMGTVLLGALIAVAIGVFGYAHFTARRLAARAVLARIARRQDLSDEVREWVESAFASNTRALRTVLLGEPVGWNAGARRRLSRVLADADRFVQTLNNRFADPSGGRGAGKSSTSAVEIAAAALPEDSPPQEPAVAEPGEAARAPEPETPDEAELAGEGAAADPAVRSLAAASKR